MHGKEISTTADSENDFEFWKSEKQGTEFAQSRSANIGVMYPTGGCWVIDNYLESIADDYRPCAPIKYLSEKLESVIERRSLSVNC